MTDQYDPFWLEVTGDLKPEGPFRIGSSGQLDLYSDMAVLRYDGRHGHPWLPGSSIRGVLRAHLFREHSLLGVGSSAVKALFGDAGRHGVKKVDPKMGRLRVFDSVAAGSIPLHSSEVRDHVQINPDWGAAADRLKFDAEVMLQFEWAFPLHVVYEGPAPGEPEDLILLGEIVHALESGLIRIGGRSGIGMGRFSLGNVSIRKFDRSTEDGLQSWLKYRLGDTSLGVVDGSYPFPLCSSSTCDEDDKKPPLLPPWHSLHFEMALHCEGPLLVKSALKGVQPNPDAQPITTGNDIYYLPGSSLRGVLRAHAYRIVDSQRTGDEPWLRLFGAVKDKQTGRKGLLEIQDGTVSAEQDGTVSSDHVTIDRIISGAAGSAKFDDKALDSPKIDAILEVRFTDDPEDRAAVALLLLVIRDLLDPERRRLWAGSQTTRGYGLIRQAVFKKIEGISKSESQSNNEN